MSTTVTEYTEPTILSKQDMGLYNANLLRLEDIVAKKFEDGVPKDNRDIRVTLEAINASNTALLKKGELNIKSKQQEDQSKSNATIVEIMKAGRIARSKKLREIPIVTEVADTLIPDFELVEGQLELGQRPLDLEEVLSKGTIEIEDDEYEI